MQHQSKTILNADGINCSHADRRSSPKHAAQSPRSGFRKSEHQQNGSRAQNAALPSVESNPYSRYSYMESVLPAGKSPARKRKFRKRILMGVFALLLVFFGSTVAYGSWYLGSVQDNMSFGEEMDDLSAALVKSDYKEPFYVLLIGSDNWEEYGARSDAMLLARIDLNEAVVTMVSVPRDTPYQFNGEKVKLNQVYAEQGEAACVSAVSQLTGIPIAHYARVEFDQFAQVVDGLGGIEVDVPYAIDYDVYTKDRDTVHIDKGKQTLNGEQAVALARMRTAYKGEGDPSITQDAIRQANVRAMMVSMIKKILDSAINEIPGKIEQLSNMVKTDIPLSTLVDWATKFAAVDKVTIYSCTGPTAGELDDETGLWLTFENPEAWKSLMEVVDSGEDPSKVLSKSSEDGSVKLDAANVIENN